MHAITCSLQAGAKTEEVKHPIETGSMDLDGWLCMCGDCLILLYIAYTSWIRDDL